MTRPATKRELRDALYSIMDAARNPDGIGCPSSDHAARNAYALGWIEAIARHALREAAPTTGWLAVRDKEPTA
jgi:hypothetical protein